MMKPSMFACCAILLAACSGGGSNDSPAVTPGEDRSNVLVIPMVVHVLYDDEYPESNLSNEKILSQLAVLNQDFRALNEDLNTVPDEFVDLIADVEIEFKMAEIDPNGMPTSGITRTLQGNTELDDIYFTNSGGKDAWPTDQYLNIWLYDSADRNGRVGFAGSGQFPGGDPLTDGVVMDYRMMGTVEPLYGTNTKGRTATHEIGHWLNLIHIFGEKESCDITDLVDDTPTSFTEYRDKPDHPASSCGSNDMFMNFMDYSDDDVLVMFTKGQKARMRAVFEPGGGRYDLYQNIIASGT